MKRILLTATLLVTAAGAAAAMTSSNGLSGPDRAHAQRLVPNGDFSNLTAAQANAIAAILSSDEGSRGGQIRAILN